MIEIIKKATPIPKITMIKGSIAVVKPFTASLTSLSKYSDALVKVSSIGLKGKEIEDSKTLHLRR
jgi:hypothetical protein